MQVAEIRIDYLVLLRGFLLKQYGSMLRHFAFMQFCLTSKGKHSTVMLKGLWWKVNRVLFMLNGKTVQNQVSLPVLTLRYCVQCNREEHGKLKSSAWHCTMHQNPEALISAPCLCMHFWLTSWALHDSSSASSMVFFLSMRSQVYFCTTILNGPSWLLLY